MRRGAGYPLALLVLFLGGIIVASILLPAVIDQLDFSGTEYARVQASYCGHVLTILNDSDERLVIAVYGVLSDGTTRLEKTILVEPGQVYETTIYGIYEKLVLVGEGISEVIVINDCIQS